MDRRELIETLQGIDEEAYLLFGEEHPPAQVVIVGSGVLILHGLTKRPVTYDIDILAADEAVRGILEQYPQVNGAVSAHADNIPYNFEDRLSVLDIGARAIEFLVPSLEDLVVMKLYALRPNDIADLTSDGVLKNVDWDKLHTLVHDPQEAKASCLSEKRYWEMVGAYERYEKKWRK